MDNFRIDITAEGQEALAMAIGIAMTVHRLGGCDRDGKIRGITHYAVREAKEGVKTEGGGWAYNQEPRPLRMVFFRVFSASFTASDKVALPFVMTSDAVSKFAQLWLEQCPYPPEPGHDGSNGKGWRIYNESWQCVDGDRDAIIAVTPEWAWYGK